MEHFHDALVLAHHAGLLLIGTGYGYEAFESTLHLIRVRRRAHRDGSGK